MNNYIQETSFWEHFKDQPVFCGFNEYKHPIGMDGLTGIAADSPPNRLGTYEQAKELKKPFVGISLNKPVMLGDLYLVCIDLDWKKSLTGAAHPEQMRLMGELTHLNCSYETSHSGKGAHFWVLSKLENIPKSWKLTNNCEIEVFSGVHRPLKNVLITDYDVMGELKEVNLLPFFPKEAVQEPIKKVKKEYTVDIKADFARTPELLSYISAQSYDDKWIPVGLILKSHFGADGFNLWDNWSKTAENYNPQIMGHKWASFNGEGLGFASLVKMAQEGGYQFKPLRSTPQEDFGDFDIESGEIKFTINNGSKNPWKDRIHAISTNLVPPNWLIDGLLADKMTMIAGSPGVGKTSCLVPLALVVAGFQSHLSNVSSKYNRKVIYVTEDKWQIDSIIHGVIKHMVTPDGKKITYEMIAERFIVVETVKSRIPDIIRLADLAADYALQIGNIKMNPLVVFDTSSASFQIDDENNNAEASKFVAALKENFIKYHIPVWIVAHTAKVNKRADVAALSVRGAGAFEGDANCVAYLVAEEGVDKRYFILGKHRYAAKYREVAIDSVVHQEMALNIYGDPEDVYYRYSTLERSSEGQRIAAKEEAKADKAEFKNQMYRDRIFYAVDTLDDPIISKVAKFKGDPTKNYELIEWMVTEGELHLIDTGRIHKGQPVMLVKRVQK